MADASLQLEPDWETSNRREGDRHQLVLRVAKLIHENGEMPCLLKNVSQSGCQIRTYCDMPEGREFQIAIGNDIAHRCEKRWQKDNHAGFQFLEEIDIEPFLHINFGNLQKRALRINAMLPITLLRGIKRDPALLQNISQTGICIAAPLGFSSDEEVTIRFPSMATFNARHVWSHNDHHGLRFAGVIPLEVFARLCAPAPTNPISLNGVPTNRH